MTSESHMNQGPEDEREQEARKIVAHSSHFCPEYNESVVVVRENNDQIWIAWLDSTPDKATWQKLPPLPES